MSWSRTRAGNKQIADFLQWIADNSITEQHGSSLWPVQRFIPFPVLSDYLIENKQGGALRRLLGAVYEKDADKEGPVSIPEIASGRLKIFCILLCLGELDKLQLFIPYDNLKDEHLPFKLDSPPHRFPDLDRSFDFFRKFCEEQWRFCAPSIDYNPDRVLEDSEILPITSKVLLRTGVSAKIYKITLHDHHNNLIDMPRSRGPSNESPPLILKTYKDGRAAERFYYTEVAALRRFGGPPFQHPHIIRFYGAFTHRDTRNVLLEYADRGSLEDYWEEVGPPTSGKTVIKLWIAMFGIIRALRDLHNGDEIFWHQDVKPANILVLTSGNSETPTPYECTFKLADFGNSHSRSQNSADALGTDRDTQGTRTYGPPECYRPNDVLGEGSIRVSPNVDIWSLGCVLSEFAVWLYFGQEGLKQYGDARRSELKGIPGFRDDDCFHNGKRKLSCVKAWHDQVGARVPESDTVTKLVLQMSEEMLRDVSTRREAHSFCIEAYTIRCQGVERFCELFPKDTIEEEMYPPTPLETPRKRVREIPIAGPYQSTSSEPSRYANVPRPGPSPAHGYSESSPAVMEQLDSIPEGMSPLTRPRLTSLPNHSRGPYPFVQDQNYNSLVPATGMPSHQHSTVSDSGQYRRSNRNSGRSDTSISTTMNSSVSSAMSSFSPNSSQGSDSGNQLGSPLSYPSFELSTLPRPSTSLPLAQRQRPIASEVLESHSHSTLQAVPPMTIEEAEQWRDNGKKLKKKNRPAIRDSWILDDLDGRDSIFIIDDSACMEAYHVGVTRLFGILAYMIKSRDKTGLDLIFARTQNEINNNKHTSTLVDLVKSRKFTGDRDLSIVLEKVLDDYVKKLDRESSPVSLEVPKLNVYIFTDGIWRPQCDLVPAIDKVVKKMISLGKFEKQIGLQFISFGHNPDSIARLDLLDNGLGLKYDIVDTTPSTGDLFKMIVGAIDKNFDHRAEGYAFATY